MKISVWDTYVTRTDGKVMHFDILVPSSNKDTAAIFNFGRQYLADKPFETGKISSEQCKFCHTEQAVPEIIDAIENQGFYIIEMENCK